MPFRGVRFALLDSKTKRGIFSVNSTARPGQRKVYVARTLLSARSGQALSAAVEFSIQSQIYVNGVGQECPTHTGIADSDVRVKV